MDKFELVELLVKILKPHKKEGLHITAITKELKDLGVLAEGISDKVLREDIKELLDEQVKTDGEFDRVKKDNGGVKSGYYKLRKKRAQPPTPPRVTTELSEDTSEELTHNTQFFGKAGEYAVMTELLFRGFNANNMTVDEGIDIIASKGNNFYFVQVKTTTLKSNKSAIVQIQQKNFDKFINQQMRYVIVVKHEKGMRFFTLSNAAIEQLRYYNALSTSERTGNISIKIKFDDRMQSPVFYDRAEADATYYEGFKRIEL